MTETIKISQGIALDISNTRRSRISLAVFLKLKSLYVGASIHSLHSRRKEISKKIGYSPNTVKKYLKILEDDGFVWYEGSVIRFRSTKWLIERFSSSRRKRWRIDLKKDVELQLMQFAYQEKQNHIKYELQRKTVQDAVARFGPIHSDRLKERLSAGVRRNLDFHLEKNHGRNKWDLMNGEKLKINTAVTLSRIGFAKKIIGSNSVSSGQYWIKKLEREGLIKDEKNILLVRSGVNFEIFKNLDYPKSYFYNKGCIFIRLSNNISTII